MKPAWTAMVSQAACVSWRPQAARSVGIAAVPVNQVDPARSTPSETPARARLEVTRPLSAIAAGDQSKDAAPLDGGGRLREFDERGVAMKAIRITETGGPEVMRLEDLPTPEPQAGQLLVRVEAAGVNYIDIYQRSGQYKVPLPYTVGLEGAGVVEATGPGVTGIETGARVAWTNV